MAQIPQAVRTEEKVTVTEMVVEVMEEGWVMTRILQMMMSMTDTIRVLRKKTRPRRNVRLIFQNTSIGSSISVLRRLRQ